MNVSFKLVQFALSHPLGQGMANGHSNMSQAAEDDLLHVAETFSKSVAENHMGDLEQTQASPALPELQNLLQEAAVACDPKDADKFPFGFSLLPSAVEHSAEANIFSIDLSPVDMRFASPSPVYDKPVARLFVDTTPGQDGVEFLLAH